MARRSKEQFLQEFHRLSDAFEAALDMQEKLYPEMREHRDVVLTRDDMLQLVEDGRATASQIFSGTREAVTDLICGLKLDSADPPPFAVDFLNEYRRKTGRDFFADASRPNQKVQSLVKRGTLKTDEEFRLLMGALNDTDQKTLSPKQAEKANEMLLAYEVTK